MELFKDCEFRYEFADGDLATESFVNARFDHGKDGAPERARMRLAGELNGAGVLVEKVSGTGLLVIRCVEPDESAVAGLELEPFRPGFGDDLKRFVIGMLIAELNDALLVFQREECEFGARFPGFGSVHNHPFINWFHVCVRERRC